MVSRALLVFSSYIIGFEACRKRQVSSANNFVSQLIEFRENVKGVLNPNFRLISFELNKNKFFKINFNLGFRVL